MSPDLTRSHLKSFLTDSFSVTEFCVANSSVMVPCPEDDDEYYDDFEGDDEYYDNFEDAEKEDVKKEKESNVEVN